jgi:hypothetical protein
MRAVDIPNYHLNRIARARGAGEESAELRAEMAADFDGDGQAHKIANPYPFGYGVSWIFHL